MRTIAPVRCYTLAAIYYIYHMKYKSSDSQGEILPNLLKLKSLAKINESEFEGFLKAEIYFTENLNSRTKFSKTYILKLHKLALQHLYSFAYKSREQLINDIAIVHGELLFIHPFREGNGRTARLLANLMCRKAGYDGLMFEKIGKKEFEKYVAAVQSCANKDYKKMIEFITSIFPS